MQKKQQDSIFLNFTQKNIFLPFFKNIYKENTLSVCFGVLYVFRYNFTTNYKNRCKNI